MTDVSFYKLSGNLQVALALVCQLAQKALKSNQQVLCQPEYEQAKRDNFKFYKERGYPLSFHDLSEKFKP